MDIFISYTKILYYITNGISNYDFLGSYRTLKTFKLPQMTPTHNEHLLCA